MPEYRDYITDLSRRTGASVEESDIAALQGKNPEDVDQFKQDLEAQYRRRASNVPGDDNGDGSDDRGGDGDGGGGGGIAAQAVNYTRNPQLDEMMSQLLSNQKTEAERKGREADERATWRNQMRGNIMGEFNKAAAPVDPNDPIISRARQVHDAASQRAFNTGREAMAARSIASGTGQQGASDAYLQSSSENLAKDNSSYESGLMMDEVKQRRQQVLQLLNLGSGVLTADENRMLQEEMGTMDAQLKQLGLTSGAYLGGMGIQSQRDLGFGGLDIQRMGLSNQNQQFYDKMGNDNGMQEALMNQMIMQQLLGSGA